MATTSFESFKSDTKVRRPIPFIKWINFVILPFALSLSLALAVSSYVYTHSTSASTYNQNLTISPLRQLMGLSDISARAAPEFSLVDQKGQRVSLAQFRGKAVLLSFLDSRCTTVCPVLAQEFLLANHDLGSTASKVAFIAVNVNPVANSVADVSVFDNLHGLNKMANWYFLTGPAAKLASVWKAYGIYVNVPQNSNQVTHADYLFFITPSGQERYLASPVVDQTKNGTGYLPQPTLVQWGHGIATYLRRIL